MKTKLPTYSAKIENGAWTITADNSDGTPITYTVSDEALNEDERQTLEYGTSGDLRQFINTSGNF